MKGPESAAPPERTTWITPFYDLWMAKIGHVAPARMARVLAPMLKLHSEAELLRAMQRYIESDTTRIKKLEWWAEDLVRYLDPEEEVLVDETGVPTRAGLRILGRAG